MRTALEQRVLDFIRESRMASAGDRIGVAVSGGADSVALLRLLEPLRHELGATLFVIHFDHMLRGAESDRDVCFVKELARARGMELLKRRRGNCGTGFSIAFCPTEKRPALRLLILPTIKQKPFWGISSEEPDPPAWPASIRLLSCRAGGRLCDRFSRFAAVNCVITCKSADRNGGKMRRMRTRLGFAPAFARNCCRCSNATSPLESFNI
jgi:hypothetical protein